MNWIKRKIIKWLEIEKSKPSDNIHIDNHNEFYENYIYDFKVGYRGRNDSMSFNSVPVLDGGIDDGIDGDFDVEKKPTVKKKITIKPIDVLNELERIPTSINLNNLDDKIDLLKRKSQLIKHRYTREDVDGMIVRLENRKKYMENKTFFDRFPYTNDEKIDKILSKYKLVMEKSDLFIPEFPKDAVDVIAEYTEVVKNMCGKKPVFYVIAEEELFDKSYSKRDPILLVQCPFSYNYQILGA